MQGPKPPSGKNLYANIASQRYLVKKSEFSKAAFAALQGEDRARYFRERADIVRDGEPGDEHEDWQLAKKLAR